MLSSGFARRPARVKSLCNVMLDARLLSDWIPWHRSNGRDSEEALGAMPDSETNVKKIQNNVHNVECLRSARLFCENTRAPYVLRNIGRRD